MNGRLIRVLHVIVDLEAGGAERALVNLVTRNEAPDVEHHVLCLRLGGFYEGAVRKAGVPLHIAGGEGVRALPGWIAAVRRAVAEIEPDVLQGWMYYANLVCHAALRFPWPRLRRRPKLVWGIRCSDMDLDRYPKNLRRAVRLGARWSGSVAAIVANSHAGRDVHVAAGYAAERFEVIPNGFDADAFRPDPSRRAAAREALGEADDARFVALTVARIDPMKDYDTLAAAARTLPEVRFVAAGLETERLDGPANLTGLGRRPDVDLLLQGADCLVSSSAYGEGMSNAIGEAMACGLPVVATDVGDAARMLAPGPDGEPAGLVVPPRDPAALAESVRALADDPEGGRAMGAEGRRRVETVYSLAACDRHYAELYRRVTA